MAKFKTKAELFEYFKQQDPLSVFQTEFGFLKLTDQQKDIIKQKTFAPGKHIFAYIAGHSDGIKCEEVSADHAHAFKKFIEEYETKALAYSYLGISGNNGEIEM